MERPGVNDTAKRAVFLDRDGTIMDDVGYPTSPDQIRILPGVPPALRRLRQAGFLLLVVTNQSALARGWLTEAQLEAIHLRLNETLGAEGAQIDAFYHCPHLPDGRIERYARDCECRKPAPGLLLRAASDWGVELSRSYMVGDSPRDVEAGRRAGCHSILIGPAAPGRGESHADDLAAAVEMILEGERSDQA